MKTILTARRNEDERSNAELNKAIAGRQSKLGVATRVKGVTESSRAQIEAELRRDHEAKNKELNKRHIDAIAEAKKDAVAK
jgi:hypothetical protein